MVSLADLERGAAQPPLSGHAPPYVSESARGHMVPRQCAAFLATSGAAAELQSLTSMPNGMLPALLFCRSFPIGMYLLSRGRLSALPHADPLPVTLIDAVEQDFRRGLHCLLMPYASHHWPLQDVSKFAEDMLHPGGSDSRHRQSGWTAHAKRLGRSGLDHLRLERESGPFHDALRYMLGMFGEPVVLAFGTCAKVLEDARRRVLPLHALQRLLETIYTPLIERLEFDVTLFAESGQYPAFGATLAYERVKVAYENLIFNVEVMPAPLEAAGSARSGRNRNSRAAAPASARSNGSIAKRGQSQPHGGAPSGRDAQGRRAQQHANGARSGAAQRGGAAARPAGGNGRFTSSDPRLAAFRKLQGQHLPPHADNSKKACAYKMVFGWCPLSQCSYSHDTPAWFDRDAFLARF